MQAKLANLTTNKVGSLGKPKLLTRLVVKLISFGCLLKLVFEIPNKVLCYIEMQKLPQALLKSFFQTLLKIFTREGLLLSKPLFYPLRASSGACGLRPEDEPLLVTKVCKLCLPTLLPKVA